MIRALAALAALCALASCGVVGPPQADLQRAVQDYYASGDHPNAPKVSNVEILDWEGCQPLQGLFRCAVVFAGDGAHVPAIVWIVREPNGGWHVQNVVPNEAPHRP